MQVKFEHFKHYWYVFNKNVEESRTQKIGPVKNSGGNGPWPRYKRHYVCVDDKQCTTVMRRGQIANFLLSKQSKYVAKFNKLW